jgi:AcrR family transcriptional regulator
MTVTVSNGRSRREDARLPLRERRRLRAMRRAQRCAVRLFTEHGYDAVTVERVAAEADVSPVSIYRWFGTKVGLVLWDEYDPAILQAVMEHLERLRPLDAVRDAIIAELDRVYDRDRELVLARAQLIHREPELLAAARDDLRQLESALRDVFAVADVGRSDFDRAVLAAAAVSVLVVAVEEWQANDGRVPLARLIADGFEVLEGAG